MGTNLEVVETVDDKLVSALGRLLPQLSSTATLVDRDTVERIVNHEANTVLVAYLDGDIVGTLTVVTFPLLSGRRARIEDVIVDAAARGQGIAQALTAKAIEIATNQGCRTVDLTSRPSREAANRLYEKAGFDRRSSIVYRLPLPQ